MTFLISGFWHGANWTYIAWGALNACYFIPLLLSKRNRKFVQNVAPDRQFPTMKECTQMVATFTLISFSWILFRAENINHALDYYMGLASFSLFEVPHFVGMKRALLVIAFIGMMLIVEWNGRREAHGMANLGLQWPKALRHAIYYAILVAISWFGGKPQEFIYFQF